MIAEQDIELLYRRVRRGRRRWGQVAWGCFEHAIDGCGEVPKWVDFVGFCMMSHVCGILCPLHMYYTRVGILWWEEVTGTAMIKLHI